MGTNSFVCVECGDSFSIKSEVLARYPGWIPRTCLRCRDKTAGKSGGGKASTAARKPAASRSAAKKTSAAKKKAGKSATKELVLPVAEVLKRFTDGPFDGVFTDGACSGNPGPGGWGVVQVQDDEVIDQRYGHDPDTTNNRMELLALINAYEMLPEDAELTIWTDSRLCVQTINEWAAGWARRGWKRKTGAVKNLDLVQRAYALSLNHPKVELRWIKAHNGSRWNEYADALATAYLRSEL